MRLLNKDSKSNFAFVDHNSHDENYYRILKTKCIKGNCKLVGNIQ